MSHITPANPINQLFYFFYRQKNEAASFIDLVKKGGAVHPNDRMNGVWQLEVVNQYADGTGRRGSENCGYHATRNALMLIELAAHKTPHSLKDLKDHQQFLPLYYLWEQRAPHSSSGDRDISIATISKIIEDVRQAHPTDPLLYRFNQSLNHVERRQENFPAISIANALLLGNQLHYPAGGDPGSLSAAAHLWQIASQPTRTLDHLFVIGISDLAEIQHWISIGLHQEGGKREWVVMDSCNNQSLLAKRVIDGLERLMKNKELFLDDVYQNYVEDIIKQRVNRLKSLDWTGEEVVPYLRDEQMKQLGLQSAQFMIQCNWLDFPARHKEQIQDLATLVHFYSAHLDPRDPLKAVYQALYKKLPQD